MGQRLDCTDCTYHFIFMGCFHPHGTGKVDTCEYFIDHVFGNTLSVNASTPYDEHGEKKE